MNIEKVFTAFNKDGKEILIYRKDNDTYINLNSDNNEIIPKQNINLETLRYLSESLRLFKYMPKKLLKKLYNYDREKLLITKEILLGVKGTINNLKETKTESGWYYYNVPIYDYHYNWKLNKEECGLYTFIKKISVGGYEFSLYKNLVDGKTLVGYAKHISSLPQFNNGMEYVNIYDQNLNEILKESVMEKKKVYELAYEAKKANIEK